MAKNKSQIAYSSRAPIRHAYDSVLTRLARLAAFASCPLLTKWGEADQRLEDLAADDLIALAIHLRRLLELTGQKGMASKISMLAIIGEKTEKVPVTKVVNGLIHHTRLTIARRKAHTLPVPTKERPESWMEWHTAFQIRMDPAAFLSSDKISAMAFRIDGFAETVGKLVLPQIVDYCDDEGLYLEDMNPD